MSTEAIDQVASPLEKIVSRVPSAAPVTVYGARTRRRRLRVDFTRLLAATTASNLSDGIRQAALPLIAASITRDPAQVAGVTFAAQAPWLFFGLASGAAVDRFNRRRIIGGAHLVRMAAVILLATALATGTATIVMLYAVAFVLGIAETLFDNASQVMVTELVEDEHLEKANGRITMAVIAGQQLVGPFLGAALFASFVSAPLFVDGLVLAAAALLVFSMEKRPTPQPAKPVPTSTVQSIRESLVWLWRNPVLRTISLSAAVVNFAIVAHIAVFVLFTSEVLGVGEFGFVALIASYAVGGLAGGALAPRIVAALGWRRAVVYALVAATVTLFVTGITTSVFVTGLMQVILAVAASVWMVATCSLRQRKAPEGMLGRITGAHQLLSWGGAALGALAGGIIATHLGLRAPFLVGAVLLAGVSLVFATGYPVTPREAPATA